MVNNRRADYPWRAGNLVFPERAYLFRRWVLAASANRLQSFWDMLMRDWLKFTNTGPASLLEVCILAVFVTLAVLVVIYAFQYGDIDLSCRGLICR